MNNRLEGIQTTFISLFILSLCLVLSFYSNDQIQQFNQYLDPVLYSVGLFTFILAAQFSHSRFSLLIATLITLYFSNSISSAALSNWQANGNWQFLSGLFVMTLFVYLKDRGLASVHLLTRVLGIAVMIGLAYSWLEFASYVKALPQNQTDANILVRYVELELPILISLVIVVSNSVLKKHLFESALLVSAVLWCLFFFRKLDAPWAAYLLFLSAYYLISVLVSSYFLAYRDELTGLPSRRALFQLALSLGRKYSVAMMDIDHFKKFNDTYGHDVGDQVLKLVASKLSKVQGGGKVFRYGGEEFTVVFPRKDAEQTVEFLEDVRQIIADYQMTIRQERKGKDKRNQGESTEQKIVSVTISIGVATREAKQSFEQVMKAADVLLYKAKKNGRNNVCH